MFRSICVAACLFVFLTAGCVSQQAHQKKINELNAQIVQLKTSSLAQSSQMESRNVLLLQELTDAKKSLDDAKRAADELAKKYAAFDAQMVDQLQNITSAVVDRSGNIQFTVSFKMGGTEVAPEERAAVEKFAATIVGKEGKVLVDGHSDNTPIASPENMRLYGDNLGLSLSRAAAVARVLVNAGIPHDSIVVRGFDSNMPVAPNDEPEGRAKNRRVEIIFMPASKDAQAAPPAAPPAQEQPATEPGTGDKEK